MVEFIEQYTAYPQVQHDDLLDCLSIGLASINPWMEQGTIEGEFSLVDDDVPELEHWRGAP